MNLTMDDTMRLLAWGLTYQESIKARLSLVKEQAGFPAKDEAVSQVRAELAATEALITRVIEKRGRLEEAARLVQELDLPAYPKANVTLALHAALPDPDSEPSGG